MDVVEMLKAASSLGLGGLIFIIWYFEKRRREMDDRKDSTLKQIIEQQVEEKMLMREERGQFVDLLEKHATLIERTVGLLDRMDQRWDRVSLK